MFLWSELLVARGIDLPIEAAILRVPHFIFKKPIAFVCGVQIFLPTIAPSGQPRKQPDHARLRHDHLRAFAFESARVIVIENVTVVLPVDGFRIPEADDTLFEILLQLGAVDFCCSVKVLALEWNARERQDHDQDRDMFLVKSHEFSITAFPATARDFATSVTYKFSLGCCNFRGRWTDLLKIGRIQGFAANEAQINSSSLRAKT